MAFIYRSAAIGAALLALTGCGGGGGSGGSSSGGSPSGGVVTVTPTPTPVDPTLQQQANAARLAKQASFGPTMPLVTRIKDIGIDAWINEQFATTGSSYADMMTPVRRNFCVNDGVCTNLHFSRTPVAMRFYVDAITQPDQLRQRVAFALAQILVTSETEVPHAAGIAAYNQILLEEAFGNYRDILQRVTMHPYMGDYLDMADSNRTAPSENYARELLQLFTMGTNQLNMDGTPKLDASGTRIPNYSSDDVKAIARALTGWTYARLDNAPLSDNYARDYTVPMIKVPTRYDTGAKSFLGTTVPAGASQEASVQAVLDAAFNHPSTPPFIASLLIGHLVTPNPSPAYVGRVAATFANNGSGVRGDMKAVIRAILTDSEARDAPGAGSGKLKDPVLLMTSLARVIGFTTDGYAFVARDTSLGQPVMRSPSVFNFYPPDFPLPGSTTLKSPASRLFTTTNILRWHNFLFEWTAQGDADRAEFLKDSNLPMSSFSRPLWSEWEALGDNVDAMVDRIDLLMFARTLTPAQRSALKATGTSITNADPAVQARKRAQMMLFVAASSPLFLVDR